MWRYYEKNGLKGKAAKLLNRLTDCELTEISLSDRLSYLSHAIICAQSTSDTESRTLIQVRENEGVGKGNDEDHDCRNCEISLMSHRFKWL